MAKVIDGTGGGRQTNRRLAESYVEAEWAALAGRLDGVPDALEGIRTTLEEGARVRLEGREAAWFWAGAAFDLKAFHARAVEFGPMGLAELGRRLEYC